MFTLLAVVFVLVLVLVIFYGFSLVVRRPPTAHELTTETCSLCRMNFDKNSLVERAVGDSKLFYFCPDCIRSLERDLEAKSPR